MEQTQENSNFDELVLFVTGIGIGIFLFIFASLLVKIVFNRRRSKGKGDLESTVLVLQKPRLLNAPKIQRQTLSDAPLQPMAYSVPFTLEDNTLRWQEVAARIDKTFNVTTHKLFEIARKMATEMNGPHSDGFLRMIPSFVTGPPSGTENGTFLVMFIRSDSVSFAELGFSNGKRRKVLHRAIHSLATDELTGSASFFQSCATLMVQFLKSASLDPSIPRKISVVCAFPIENTGISKGTLLHWSKEFYLQDAEGCEISELLMAAFKENNLNLEVSVIVNDTVASLMANLDREPTTLASIVLGTGTNAAFVEKCDSFVDKKPPFSLVNTEWGSFDSRGEILPLLKYDRQVDQLSVYPGRHLFEKMVAGRYIGEIVRCVLVDLVAKGDLFRGKSCPSLLIKGIIDSVIQFSLIH